MVVLVGFLLAGCAAPDDMVNETLAAEGYTDAEFGGVAPLTCSDSERFSQSFTATRDGRRVEGVVCCTGVFFGGCTVRH